MSGKVRPTSDIIRMIIGDINSGHLTSNSKIKVSYLQDRYKCSLSSLRESLQRLTAIGIIAHEFNKGFSVMTMSADEFESIYQCRKFVISSIIKKMRPFDNAFKTQLFSKLCVIKYISKEISNFEKDELESWEQQNSAFYSHLFEHAHSTVLRTIYTNLDQLSEPYRHCLFYLLSKEDTTEFISRTLQLQDDLYHNIELNCHSGIEKSLLDILNLTISYSKKYSNFYK